MGTNDLVVAISNRSGIAPRDARAALDAALAEISDRLARGERVTITGFGTFTTVERAARTARNPRTGAPIAVPATVTARFSAGTGLRSAVAGPARSASAPAAERPEDAAKSENGGKAKGKAKKGKKKR